MSDTPSPQSLWDGITSAFSAVGASLIRTVVPIVVGLVIGWLVSLGLPVDDTFKAAIALLVAAVANALWYLIFRLLEQTYSWASIFLGSAKQPVAYAPTTAVIDNHVIAAPASQVVGSDAKPHV